MKTVTATIEGVSPYSPSKAIQSVKEKGEGHSDFEERTWKERIHSDKNGDVYIPAVAIKLCLEDCARFLSETVPGKGKATWTKHFEAGIMCVENAYIGCKVEDAEGEKLFVPSDGKKGGSTRVWKTFPMFYEWECDVEIIVLDPLLVANIEQIREYLEHSGKFIGLGRWRPRKGGTNGRFKLAKFK